MIFDPILDFFRGEAVTIPPLDGAFRPNSLLDEAEIAAAFEAPDNLAVLDGAVVASRGRELVRLGANGAVETLHSFEADISAVALSVDGRLAVALDDGRLSIDREPVDLPPELRCITALAYGDDDTLWIASGSAHHKPSGWVADLMEKNASGSVWKRLPAGEIRKVASGIAFPYGLLADGDGIVVSESWRHRLIRLDAGGAQSVLIDKLPGYPARLSPAADGGAWLAVFAPRNRLVEFVLQETHYRRDMMASVPRDYWIAPALSTRRSFLEPLQCGGIKTMGVHKPWAPSRSGGMVVRLDADMNPVASLHSRANGSRHGTLSVVEHGGRLLVAAKGGDCVLAVDTASGERRH